MNFEWDEEKNALNIQKYDLDYFDAWEVFESPILEEPDDRFDYGEVRYTAYGLLRNLIVALSFTERNGDTIRIISMRRATKYEREKFIQFIEKQLG